MAKVKIQGHASGTGILTVTAPNTSTDRTITLPDEDVTLGAATPSIDDNGDATAITIDSSERVGIGTTSPDSNSKLHVYNGASGQSAATNNTEVVIENNSTTGISFLTPNNASSGLWFADPESNASGRFYYTHSDNSLNVFTGGTQRLKIDGDGLKFNSDTAAVNALDDYEEGTFTVTLSCAGNTDDKTCRYTKVGNIVTVNFSSTGSVNSYWQIYGSTDDAVTITSALPFTPRDNGGVVCPVVRSIHVSSSYTEDHNLVMGIGWRKNSTALYLGSGRTNDYYHTNNAVKTNTQTNITISGTASFIVS